MYKRFVIICVVIGASLLVLSALGVWSLGSHARSLRAERYGQFAAVAEQIRFDVKSKLDDFLQAEQRRPYTDYQHMYVPETANQADALLRSPLADSMTHGLAFGHFQVDAQGNITTPYAPSVIAKGISSDPAVTDYISTLKSDVLRSLNGDGGLRVRRIEPTAGVKQEQESDYRYDRSSFSRTRSNDKSLSSAQRVQSTQQQAELKSSSRGQTYRVESLEEAQTIQSVAQPRGTVERNIENTRADAPAMGVGGQMAGMPGMDMMMPSSPRPAAEMKAKKELDDLAKPVPAKEEPMVQIRIEPFVPLIVPNKANAEAIFAGQIFLLRHVQIENIHLLQGFRLNETELSDQVRQSAQRLLRKGMGVELSQTERPDAAYTAILDFGFGELVLNLLELDPGWIAARVSQLRIWMTAILVIVWLAVAMAMFGLWRSLREQVKLAQKKDDFISAVSHELRTPLTSIRMYTEMLEKDWVKDDAKRREYYGTMRQESERLTRLIENVLDFSRIQRGKKQFDFTVGDVNRCIQDVVEMMRPCAVRAGFLLKTELSPIEPFAFDRDAVTQIAINLIDNAIKYAKDADEKIIIVRTRGEKGCTLMEVEDRGPGVPKSQQDKIFEAFYRCGDESTRQTTGTGLGLALVKRFVQAHRGLVEVLNAKPHGALFRVRLAR